MLRIRLAQSFAAMLAIIVTAGSAAFQATPLTPQATGPAPVVPATQAPGTQKPGATVSVSPVAQSGEWPEVVRFGELIYPPEALSVRLGGQVQLVLNIDTFGRVVGTKATLDSGEVLATDAGGPVTVPMQLLNSPDRSGRLALLQAATRAALLTQFRPLSRPAAFRLTCEFVASIGMARWFPPPPPPSQSPSQTGQSFQTGRPTEVLDAAIASEKALETLLNARDAKPNDPNVYVQLAAFYAGRGDVDKTIEYLQQRAAVEPNNPEAYSAIATHYLDRASRGGSQLSDQEKRDYVARGLEQIDTALQLKPEYVAALTSKYLLLRLQASLETDPARQAAVLQQADALRDQTLALQKSAGAAAPQTAAREGGGAAPFPSEPNAVRVGGNIRPPTKIADAKPVYPVDATQARIQGVVIIEVLVGDGGKVQDARVLRSIPLLDQAALDAVRQWVFTPTLVNGSAVPVIMTVTVNFTLQ